MESAVNQPRSTWCYGGGDLYDVAAAYAYHIIDARSAITFLEANGIDTSRLPELQTYAATIQVADHQLDRRGLAEYLREALTAER